MDIMIKSQAYTPKLLLEKEENALAISNIFFFMNTSRMYIIVELQTQDQ
jgi:hypothetical protein